MKICARSAKTVPPLVSSSGLVRAYAFTPGEPPSEIQLWRTGDNPTDYGVHRWTARSAELVAEDYATRGNPLQIDVEHNSVAGEPAPTGGYARLVLRSGVPWLVFDWSAFAIEQIRTRQRLFLSPEYLVDKDTSEIVKLIRVSLVGAPGTHHARQLASAPKRVAASAQEIEMDPKLVSEALDALIAGDAEKAMGILKAMVVQSAGGGEPDGDEGGAEPAQMAAPPPPDAGSPPPAAPADSGPPAPDKKDDKVKTAAAPVKAAAPVPAVNPLEQRVDGIERDQLIKDNAKRFPNDSVRAWAAAQPLAVVRSFVASLPSATAPAKASAPTRGAGQGVQASQLPPNEKAALDERMGLPTSRELIERKGTSQIFRAMTREQAAQHVAAKAKAQAAGKEGAK